MERQQRTNRRLRGLLLGTALFLVMALIAGGIAAVQRGRARDSQAAAEEQALRSDAERLGTLALTDSHLDRSFLLAVAGVRLSDLPETRGDLLEVLQGTPALTRSFGASQAEIAALAASPDGRLVAAGDSTGAVRVYELPSWEPTGTSIQLPAPIPQQGLAFAPDGTTLAAATTAADTTTLSLIDIPSGEARSLRSWPSIPAAAGPPRFTRMAFSPDGQQIAVAVATASANSPVPVDQRLFMLDASTGSTEWAGRYPFIPGENEAAVAFTPQGALVTSAQQGATLIWSPRTGQITRRLPKGGPLAISPDGQAGSHRARTTPIQPSLAVRWGCSTCGPARCRPTAGASGRGVGRGGRVRGERGDRRGRAFDGAVRLWDVDSGSIVETFTGQRSGLSLAVTPDGGTALSGGADGSVAAWDLSGAHRLGRSFRWHSKDGCPYHTVFHHRRRRRADGRGVMSDGSTSLIDLQTHRLVGRLGVNLAALCRSTRVLAGWDDPSPLVHVDGTVRVWDVDARSLIRTLRFSAPVTWLDVSPDGSRLAVQTMERAAPELRGCGRRFRLGRRGVPSHRPER